jgi:hypothetical protein
MPLENDHLTQARINEEFAELLLNTAEGRFLGWAVVSLFYAAVHYGRAFLRSCKAPVITSHPGFETHFMNVSGNQAAYNLYRRLKDESERARYDCCVYTQNEVLELKKLYLIPLREILYPNPKTS